MLTPRHDLCLALCGTGNAAMILASSCEVAAHTAQKEKV